MMHRVDFLGRYIPEFGQLTCLVQHEFFHRYTADEHTLVCIDKLDAVMRTEDPKLRPIASCSKNLRILLFSISRSFCTIPAEPSGARPHSEASALFAQGAAIRLQLSSAQRRSLILLVDHHLTLSNMAQQRNLDDPETAVEFAHIVKDQKNLDALDAAHAGRWTGHERGCLVGLERITGLAALSRDLPVSLRSGGVLRADENRARLLQKRHAQTSDLITPRRSTRISNSCRTIIFGPLRSTNRCRTCSSFGAFWRTFTCGMNLRWPRRSTGRLPGTRPQHRRRFAPGIGRELSRKLRARFRIVPINILSADIYTRGDSVVLDIFRVCDAQIASGDGQRRTIATRGNNSAQCPGQRALRFCIRSSNGPAERSRSESRSEMDISDHDDNRQ